MKSRILQIIVPACLLAAGCSLPGATESAPDDESTLEGLTSDDIEGAATKALARADAAGTDFEPREESAPDQGEDVGPTSTGVHLTTIEATVQRALGNGTWGFAFRVTRDGQTSEEIGSSNTRRSMYGASTFKLFTGYTAFAQRTVGTDSLTYMLRTSNNALANYSMCKNGEKLGRYTASCAAKEYAPANMRMGDAIRENGRWLRGEGADLSPSFAMKDGSGLLPGNKLTVEDLMELLMTARASSGYPEFKNMLAQPGKASTLRVRFGGLEGKLFAKTGTYPRTGAGVKTLAGFVELGGGRTLVFAVVGNGVGAVSPAMGRIESAVRKAIAAAE